MTNINGEGYEISYDPESITIFCKGTLRLYGSEGYAEMRNLFQTVADQKPELITLDIQELQFLNSSGINTIAKFVITVRNLEASKMVVRGSSQYSWQKKSLKNLVRLMPSLTLELE